MPNDRFGSWGVVPATGQAASDDGSFASRFGAWGFGPAGDLGRAIAPVPSGRWSDASEAAPDGSAPSDASPAQPVRVFTKFVDGRVVGFPPIGRGQDASAGADSPSSLGTDDGPLTLKQAYLQYAAQQKAARAATDIADAPALAAPRAYPDLVGLPAWPGPVVPSATPSASRMAVVQSPIAQWLAGLAGVDPQDPDHLAPMPFDGTAWDASRDTSWNILTRRARATG